MRKSGVWDEILLRPFLLRATAAVYHNWMVLRAIQRQEEAKQRKHWAPPSCAYGNFVEPKPVHVKSGIALVTVPKELYNPGTHNRDSWVTVAVLHLTMVKDLRLLVEPRWDEEERYDFYYYLESLVVDSLRAFEGEECPAGVDGSEIDLVGTKSWPVSGVPFTLEASDEEYCRWLGRQKLTWGGFRHGRFVREGDSIFFEQRFRSGARSRPLQLEMESHGEELIVVAKWLARESLASRDVLLMLIDKSVRELGGRYRLSQEIDSQGPEMPRAQGQSEGSTTEAEETRAREECLREAESPPGPQLDNEPWLKIPPGPQREAVRLLWQGLQDPEIAPRIGVRSAKTVSNWFSELRKHYGREIVPTRTDLRRKGLL